MKMLDYLKVEIKSYDDKVILIGEDTLRFCEKSIKVRQGIQFFAIDDCTNISYSNLHHIDFSPIEISYWSRIITGTPISPVSKFNGFLFSK